MTRRIEFLVHGTPPPKKDGANSMWAKRTEIPRLIALRQAASDAMRGTSPLRSRIHIELEVHCPVEAGDLDNLVTGVCDGLQAADPGAKLDPHWALPDLAAVRPDVSIAIADDAQVVAIGAARAVGHDGPVWYRVALEGED